MRANRERFDAFVTTDLCGIHHVSVAGPDAEPSSSLIDMCAQDGQFALARGSELHVFAREEDTALHLTNIDGEWSREPIPALLYPGARESMSGDAMLADDGWLGFAYTYFDRVAADSSVRLLSSPPCE